MLNKVMILARRLRGRVAGINVIREPARRSSTDTFVPATLSRLDVAEGAPVIHSYLSNGFIIRRSVVYGSVGLLPRGFFNWKVGRTNGVTINPQAHSTGEGVGRNDT